MATAETGKMIRKAIRLQQAGSTGGIPCGFFQRGVCGPAEHVVAGVHVCDYHHDVVGKIERSANLGRGAGCR
jgi:hypothetical protein